MAPGTWVPLTGALGSSSGPRVSVGMLLAESHGKSNSKRLKRSGRYSVTTQKSGGREDPGLGNSAVQGGQEAGFFSILVLLAHHSALPPTAAFVPGVLGTQILGAGESFPEAPV